MKKIKKEIKDIKFLDKNIKLGERTYIMGILNVTPDSFSDGGDFIDIHNAVNHAKEMIELGVDIIDVGGESSRPGHKNITEEEELKRVIPVIKRLSAETDAIISLDTIRSEVAEEAIKEGAHIINDIWGLQKDPNMAKVAAKYKIPVIIMHNQNGTDYNNIIEDIKEFFKRSVAIAKEAGISEDMIILDPGIGFGKTPEQNIMVMSKLDEIKSLGYPVLLGTSRKSTLGKILDLPPKERVEGTLATTILGIVQGVDIVRVHDVQENLRAAKVADAIIRGE
ncbi:dihydropteroate synthase [Clostridium algidicarnis]|uniref:Dihydropteroate synthase n=1 Tax=Clostridium algidicarnis TaxID=37659 RepID=A0ABS6C5L1_9CLOT|nr:dihydropteroate synthase [Clostridium algidicarnis]MBB6632146.1 dihydropteroate synthase [Clostridium algidicarnis]MBU3220773.1 dihydropteroate synthase [Clostridium algidicarnis]MCB2286422.1 dihydropteroate synthase [Clostridium algidicarnis]